MDKKQESMMKLQALEQEANVFGEQIQLIDKQIKELSLLKNGLSELGKSSESSSYAEFGKGIYVKTNLEKGDMLVDVGSKILVPKKPAEVEGIIGEQVTKFEQAKVHLGQRIEGINKELDAVIKGAEEGEKVEGVEKKKAKGKN